MTKIKKILIANRGEIACRVIKTARKMGIATVAVYSDADRKALHVRMADEAVHIGPSPANESYLVIEKIIQAAKDTGADAVHPGYGFLSENPAFVRACEAEGLNFMGPSAESMEAMGLKDAAKKLMDAAGVPITPGYHGEDQSPKLLKAKAGMIGYPVLIKAVAGGGGKGMRKVEADKDFDAALASCQREAKSSFGNDDVLIEKYIQSPRHIEVQVFGDTHGNVVHMFERDCSLQRRHQKVIEEAPAPGMTDSVRKAMTDAAIEAAKAVNYVGAGTVEFIVDGSGKLRTDGFWFMEMNTRLQVEHPVTEEITGLDLVEWQIRVAQGEKLPAQDELKMSGHAVEARLYAENPAKGFLPSIGKVHSINVSDWTSNDGHHRIDEGLEAGDVVSQFYDPMIAKVIGFGENREDAISECHVGVCSTQVDGIATNAQFIANCLNHPEFEQGNISTSFIEDYSNILIWSDFEDHSEVFALAAAHYFSDAKDQLVDSEAVQISQTRPFTPFDNNKDSFENISGWRNNLEPVRKLWFLRNGQDVCVEKIDDDGEAMSFLVDGQEIKIHDSDTAIGSFPLQECLKHRGHWMFQKTSDGIGIQRDATFEFISFYVGDEDIEKTSSNTLTAPMPGKIITLNCAAGDSVKAGDPLVVMEAMKMEMTLEAPRDGVVSEVNFEAGALVSDGEVLLTLEDIEDTDK